MIELLGMMNQKCCGWESLYGYAYCTREVSFGDSDRTEASRPRFQTGTATVLTGILIGLL
jgi:hypothetical protein